MRSLQAVIHRGQAAYEQVLAVYRKAANPSQKINAIAALTRAEDPALIDQTLAMIATPDVKDQDVLIFLGALSANASARRALSAWFKTEYAALFKRFETTMTMPRLVLYALSDLSSQKDYDEMKAFFADKDTGRCVVPLPSSSSPRTAHATDPPSLPADPFQVRHGARPGPRGDPGQGQVGRARRRARRGLAQGQQVLSAPAFASSPPSALCRSAHPLHP